MRAIERHLWLRERDLWLRNHPGRTAAEYKRLPGSELLEWRIARARAEVEAEKPAFEQ